MFKHPILEEILDQMPAGPVKMKALFILTIVDMSEDYEDAKDFIKDIINVLAI